MRDLAALRLVLVLLGVVVVTGGLGTAHAASPGDSVARRVVAHAASAPRQWVDERSVDGLEVFESSLDPDRGPVLLVARNTVYSIGARASCTFVANRSAQRDQRQCIVRPLRLGGADADPDTPTGS